MSLSGAAHPADQYADIKRRVHKAVITAVGPTLFSELNGNEDDIRETVAETVFAFIDRDQRPLSRLEREVVAREVLDEVLGFGPIDRFLRDESVTEIMVNGAHDVWIERDGKLSSTDVEFVDDDHVRRIIDKIVSGVGRRIDESSAMVDARLPDGSRVNAVLPPLSIKGPLLTIRKFKRNARTMHDLVQLGTVSQQAANFLEMCVRARLSMLLSGGTGSGKTTLLDALSAAIPESERIVTIEDSAELQLHQRHWLPLEAKPANIEGRGQVTIRDLVRNALRMRPDRIVVGEVRGDEAVDMLNAMNTGHDGSLSTIHANSPADAIDRLETLVLGGDIGLPIEAIRKRIARALQIVIQIDRSAEGRREITSIVEVVGYDANGVSLAPIFERDADGGSLVWTRNTPKCLERMGDLAGEAEKCLRDLRAA